MGPSYRIDLPTAGVAYKRIRFASEMTGEEGMVETSTWVQVFLIASKGDVNFSMKSCGKADESEIPEDDESVKERNDDDCVKSSNVSNDTSHRESNSVIKSKKIDDSNSNMTVISIFIAVIAIIMGLNKLIEYGYI